MIDSDQRQDSNRHPLTSLSHITSQLKDILNQYPFQILRSMADLLVRVRVRAYASDVIRCRFEKVRKWETAIDLRIGRQFKNLKKDIDLRIGHRLQAGRPSESYIYINIFLDNLTSNVTFINVKLFSFKVSDYYFTKENVLL
jgi:hypothetical protein